MVSFAALQCQAVGPRAAPVATDSTTAPGRTSIMEQDESLTAEIYSDLSQPDDVNLSSQSMQAVYSLRGSYCRSSEHSQSSLWLVDFSSQPSSSRQLTRGTYHDHSPAFAPDGRSILFLSDRDEAGKGHRLYILPTDGIGGEAVPFFPENEHRKKDETQNQDQTSWASKPEGKGVTAFKWSPDGSKVAFLSADEDSPERKKQVEDDKDDVKVWGENWDHSRLRIVDFVTKKVVVADTGDVHVSMFDWSPDGRSICWLRTETPDLDAIFKDDGWLSILDVDQNLDLRYRKDVICSKPGPVSLGWSDEGICWVGNIDSQSLISARATYCMSQKSIEDRSYMVQRSGFGNTDDAINLQRCQNKVISYVHNGTADELWPVGSSTSLLSIKSWISSWDVKTVSGQSIIAFVTSSVSEPPELWICQCRDGSGPHDVSKKTQVTHHSKHVAGMRLGTIQWLSYETADGFPIDGYYSIPNKMKSSFDKKKPLPTVVVTHGGPYFRYTETFQAEHAPWLMAQGYLVLVANYRGGSGHGNDYAAAIRGDVGASYQDIVWLAKKGIEEGHIDKDKLAIHGWSQGGYLSYMAITHDSDLHFAAAIPGAGITDWATMGMTSDLPTIETALAGVSPWTSDPTDTRDRSGSPIYHMKNINTAVLILHGENDVRVPVSQAIAFHHGMRAHGKECEMAIYPREGHGNNPEFERAHFIDMMKRMQRFLKKHIG